MVAGGLCGRDVALDHGPPVSRDRRQQDQTENSVNASAVCGWSPSDLRSGERAVAVHHLGHWRDLVLGWGDHPGTWHHCLVCS